MKRIRNRIVLAVSIFLVVGLFVGALLALQWLENADIARLKQTLADDVRLLSIELSVSPSQSAANGSTVTLFTAAQQLGHSIYVVDHTGTVTFSSNSSIKPGMVATWFPSSPNQGQAPRSFNGAVGEEDMLFAAAPIQSGPYQGDYVVAGTPLGEQYTRLIADWKALALEFTALCLALIFLAYFAARRIAAPLEHIASTIEHIAKGDVRLRVPYFGEDEYGKISTSINSLTSKLNAQMDDLTQEKSKVQGIIGQMVSGVCMVDRSGVIQVANRAFASILGAPHQHLVGHSHWESSHSPKTSEMIDKVLLQGTSEHGEVVMWRGGELDIDLFCTPIHSQNGEVVGAVVVLHDITQFKRVEKMRTEFVANVSHELRTPVTALKGFAETLLDGAIEDPQLCRQFVQIMYDESERMSRLILDLLELSKIESGHSVFKFQSTDLNQVVESVAKALQNQAVQNGITLSVDPADKPAFAEVAAERIEQVLINLIANAIAYTPSPGRVDISVANANDHIEVRISDTGIGIPESDLPHIFERFYRVDKDRSRSTGGTGLGLAIVKHIVENHRGTLHVESIVGKGSTFSFSVPKKQPVVDENASTES